MLILDISLKISFSLSCSDVIIVFILEKSEKMKLILLQKSLKKRSTSSLQKACSLPKHDNVN